jgi:hypothetical protein
VWCCVLVCSEHLKLVADCLQLAQGDQTIVLLVPIWPAQDGEYGSHLPHRVLTVELPLRGSTLVFFGNLLTQEHTQFGDWAHTSLKCMACEINSMHLEAMFKHI